MSDKIVWGISALHHDAALCVIRIPEEGPAFLLYASHAERYSRAKNDANIHPSQIKEALAFGEPAQVYWYEDPWQKRIRWIRAGQLKTALYEEWPSRYVRALLEPHGLRVGVTTGQHHKSHLYSVLSTNPYRHLSAPHHINVSLIVDAIGEVQTTSLWHSAANVTLVREEKYPRSLGLLYASATQHLGLKPMEEEYIVMGMVAYGTRNVAVADVLQRAYTMNLHHGFPPEISTALTALDPEGLSIAVELQHLVNRVTSEFLAERKLMDSIGLGGGVALNCLNNQYLAAQYPRIPVWVYPNAGDAGACIGAVMQHYPDRYLNWSPTSGTDLGVMPLENVKHVVSVLSQQGACGVAHGRAEFGPRALGNRSILADPRIPAMKDRVNQYKNRQAFRPLAPMVLDGEYERFFDIPSNVTESARYMQVVVNATPYARKEIPAVVHVDGTARVQIVRSNDPVYPILSEWYRRSGCPVLLNTSLNIKGEPLVNNSLDAAIFEHTVNIPVITARTPL